MSGAREFDTFPDMVGRLRRRGGAYVADNAVVLGDVRLGADVSVWFGVTIRGDDAGIEIGEASNVQDGTVIHADPGAPQRIGKGVTIGHGAILHGVEVGDYALIGMGAVLLGGARVGAHCIVAAGAVVPENAVVPARSLVAGVPAKVRREVTDEEVREQRLSAAHYVERARSYLPPEG